MLFLGPDLPIHPPPPPPETVKKRTPLYIPIDLTQKAPNKGKIEKELTAESIAPRPVVKAPSPVAPAKRTPPPAPVPSPKPQIAQTIQPPRPVVIEQPRPEAPKPEAAPPPPVQVARVIPPPEPPPQPAPQTPPQPRLELENVNRPPAPSGRPTGAIERPNTTIEAAVRSLAHSGLQAGQSVGDIGADEGIGSGLNLPPSAGRPRSSLQLKSDPLGVDFRPYLLQVLAAVRRNWFAVYPEAARLGQRGQVVLEFSIAKQGAVVKVVFSTESGAKALDQAAVAAISASNPLPSLPADFKGDRIVLQMTFLYNMAR